MPCILGDSFVYWILSFFYCRVLFLFLVSGVFLLFGWVGVVVVVYVGVVFVCLFVWVVVSGLCLLEGGSLYVGCVGFISSGVGLCRGRLRVVGGGGCVVLLILFLSLIR